ncbi:MAG: HAMP domain-containing histidine kinase [Betaproteobacteria bacterium AqS2]|uniref:histidine kinase n=1 Tax=Candidatus Amphirhobacter heronislandensis TaxID=1732024 RepID=A0A930UFF5_9GAMM|nr:HAMP domain-containing histidine kinase [Betaproteobacteria bacterium AqS2]
MAYGLALALLAALGLAAALALRLRADRRLRRGLAELEAAIERRRAGGEADADGPSPPPELRRLRRLVAELIEAQEVHLRNAAHEIRTPLTRLRLALALDGGRGQERAAAEIDRINALVEELLERARLLTPALRPALVPTDLGALAADLLADEFAGREELAYEAPGQPVVCPCDPVLIRRCLACLLDNSLKHSDLAPGSVRLSLAARGDEAVIGVADRGRHIPAAALARVFEPFVRLEEDGGGTGLGLAIAEAAVRAHGGSISCSSPPAGGLAFEIILPAA